ncbi:MAG TPA: winged helix-turn-helix domain-containing protein, partial [Pyrinomonadaceae bacterium]|nr:winged helix-turn-helix domain-containing protein [Pyrinomonadaceae bacterium]
QNVALTPRAFDVLLFLIKNGGRVVEKQEIFDEVWKDIFVGDNALTKVVKEIRHALADDAGNPHYIETVPKRGYRFLPDVRLTDAQQTIHEAAVFDLPSETHNKISDTKSYIPGSDGPQNTDDIQNLPAATLPLSAESYVTKSTSNVLRLAEWRHETDKADELGNPRETSSEPKHNAKIRPFVPATQVRFLHLFKQNRLITIFIAACFIIIIAVFAWPRFSENQSPTSAGPVDSIAILPFENAAQDPDVEYLSDGITESLINRLSQLSNLKVMSSSSVFRYKGKKEDTQKVGSDLNVRVVLTGGVKQIGDQLIVNVSLDDAKDNHHIWGEQYVRKFADILEVQNEIAQEVSTTLQVKLTGSDKRQLAKRYTDNVEAYQLYLKGNYEWNKHTREDLQKGIDYYNQALEKDPNYALAYFGLAASYSVLGNNYLPPHEAYPAARTYAAKALAIDDTLAEAHVAMGAIKLFYDWDFAGAEKEFKSAQILDPNNAETHHLYGDCLEIMGRFDEAKAERKRALELDPLSPSQNIVAGATFYFAGQYDEAIEHLEKTVDLVPNYYPYVWLGQAYEQKKMYEQAIATYQKGLKQGERHWQILASLGHAYALAGERGKALKILDELREMSKHGHVSPYSFAVVYMGLGEKDHTFTW